MQNYKDNLGALHVLDDVSFEPLLKQNFPALTFTKITQAQADAISNPPKTAAQSLLEAQNSAYIAIDAQAGKTRSKYITVVAGQDVTYQSKAMDATAYKAAGYPFANIANYPWVQAEAKAINGLAPTAAQYQAAADSIILTQAQWAVIGSSIEQQRRAGKIAVAAATMAASAQTAQNTALTALAAL